MNDTMKRYTSRKFWAAMVWQAAFTSLLWAGKLPVDAFVSLTWMLLGGYFAANVAQSVLKPKAEAEAAKLEAEALDALRGNKS